MNINLAGIKISFCQYQQMFKRIRFINGISQGLIFSINPVWTERLGGGWKLEPTPLWFFALH